MIKEDRTRGCKITIEQDQNTFPVSHKATVVHENSDEVLTELRTSDVEKPVMKLLLACQGLVANRRVLRNAKR